MVWASISLRGHTDLYVIQNGNLTGERYKNEILDAHVRPYAGAIGTDFLLMDDNARPHRARVVDQYLNAEAIERMDWPARSPDLNPIEHAWDMLQRALSTLPVQPRSLQELGLSLTQVWNHSIPQQRLTRLIASMRRRCEAVIAARSGHTRY